MMRSLKKLVIAIVIFFIASAAIFAQSAPVAVIRDLAGTVELKKPGSVTWEAAARGQTLAGDTTISTGFKSTAVIALGDSLLTVQPLTRLTLTELSRLQNNDKVTLNLQTGKVRAEVKPQEGFKTEFTVKSSSATASVRGTVFEFDTFNLMVKEGTVAFVGASGTPVLIDGGGLSYAGDRSGRVASREEAFMAELKPDLPKASEVVAGKSLSKPSESTVEIIVNITF